MHKKSNFTLMDKILFRWLLRHLEYCKTLEEIHIASKRCKSNHRNFIIFLNYQNLRVIIM